MTMNPKEKALQEQRTNEATRDNMMGSAGKLGIIARWLGSPIINQNGGLYDVTYLEDAWKNTSNDLPIAEDENIVLQGYIFDGLSRGMHLEIKYDDDEKKLSVDYKGHRVFTEIAGDLYSYAPFPEWIAMINKLYKLAIDKQKATLLKNKKDDVVELQKQQFSFLQKLRMRWGI